MLITIIIPYYNIKEKFFCKCLNCLEQQTYKNFEVIIVDDSSTESCLDVVNDYKMTTYVLKTENHSGYGAARQLGLEKATGDFIVFLDADDEFLEHSFLALMLSPFIQNKEVEISFSKQIRNETEYSNMDSYLCGKMFSKKFLKKNGIHFTNTMSNDDKAFCIAATLCSKKCVFVKEAHCVHNSTYNQNNEIELAVDYVKAIIECYNIVKMQNLENTKKSINFFLQTWYYLFFLLNGSAYQSDKQQFNELVEQIRIYYEIVLKNYRIKESDKIYLQQASKCLNLLQNNPLQIGLNEFNNLIINKGVYSYNDIVKLHKEVNN